MAVIVGITGGSGAGKTTFAGLLRERLGGDVAVIAHDDYYKNLPDIAYSEETGYDFDTPDALRTDELVEHLRALKDGRAADIPSFDFATHMRRPQTRRLEPAPVILLDGLFIMCDPGLRAMLDLSVFMDADADVRALRRIERDCRERAIGLHDAVEMYLKTVKPAHAKYVEPCKDLADFVVRDAYDPRALEAVALALSMRSA